MRIDPKRWQTAIDAGMMSTEQGRALWDFLAEGEREAAADVPAFRAAHVLFYLGGLLAMAALSLFMTLAWEAAGGWGMLGLALVYVVVAIGLAEYWRGRQPIPSGLMAALAVAVVPLGVYGLQHALGWWPDLDGERYTDLYGTMRVRWTTLELATVVAGLLLLWRYARPILMLPIAIALWFLAIDSAPVWWESPLWDQRAWLALGWGALILVAAIAIDDRRWRLGSRTDFAFWLYVCGGLSFWGGLSVLAFEDPVQRWVYLGANLALIALATLVGRRVLAAYGGIGVVLLLGYLAYDAFADSLAFPVALSLIGLAVVGLGLFWQRHEASWALRWQTILPAHWRRLRS